jgi:hypothetical protein
VIFRVRRDSKACEASMHDYAVGKLLADFLFHNGPPVPRKETRKLVFRSILLKRVLCEH